METDDARAVLLYLVVEDHRSDIGGGLAHAVHILHLAVTVGDRTRFAGYIDHHTALPQQREGGFAHPQQADGVDLHHDHAGVYVGIGKAAPVLKPENAGDVVQEVQLFLFGEHIGRRGFDGSGGGEIALIYIKLVFILAGQLAQFIGYADLESVDAVARLNVLFGHRETEAAPRAGHGN
jgi:hypothetical protein